MDINSKELNEKVDDLIKENGKWLDEEGSVNIHEYKFKEKGLIIIQLHSTLENDKYKPFFRVYSIVNKEVNYEKFTDDIIEAIKFFNEAVSILVSN